MTKVLLKNSKFLNKKFYNLSNKKITRCKNIMLRIIKQVETCKIKTTEKNESYLPKTTKHLNYQQKQSIQNQATKIILSE